MRRPMIAANWKLNGSVQLCEIFASNLAPTNDADVCLFPTALHLARLSDLFRSSQVATGAQNVHHETTGAYTGEISAAMVADLGGRYVLVGHSERRALFGETDAIVAKKYKTIMEAGLTPVLCIGETLEERESGMAYQTVQRQLCSVEETCGHPASLQSIIAYEPVWAIGTGKAATAEIAQDMHAKIRDQMSSYSEEWADTARILYGGSVKSSNASELFAQADVDGFLVGGASLEVDEFNQICKVVAA